MKRKKIVSGLVFLVLAGGAGIYFSYAFIFKEARSIASEAPDFGLSATKLLKEYSTNSQKADSLYLNKTIEITGRVTKETDSAVVLENSVFCLLSQKDKKALTTKQVTLKGKCIGYDELFQEVKLDQCTINKPNN